ncbi:MAG TPA: ABC transporter permease [Gemmatimonadaceae bacterium]|nr:ABC transporter permease [Gemmatimonadaceae bacterium]
MRRLLAARAAQAVVVVAVVATVVFALIHLAPGDPFAAALDSATVSPAVRAEWRARYGLDQPLPVQYVRWLGSVARGDLGWSFSRSRPVAAAIASALPNTLVLMGTALALSVLLGIGAGLLQAARRDTLADRGSSIVLLIFYSMPEFWLGLMLLLAFAYALPIFPVSGVVDPVLHDYLGRWGRIADRLRHLALPALTLTLLLTAAIARHQRAALLDVARADFTRTARAKGLAPRVILVRHTLRNSLGTTITLLGLMFPALLGGAVIVETVFAWPGMGALATSAIGARDYPLVTATAMIGAVMTVAGGLLADVLTAAADPRLRDA